MSKKKLALDVVILSSIQIEPRTRHTQLDEQLGQRLSTIKIVIDFEISGLDTS